MEKRETAAGSSVTQLSVTETWLAGAPNAFAAGRLKMEQAVNGVQTHYTYAPTTNHGALYSVTAETRINGEPVPGQSTRRVSYITAEGNAAREENLVLLPTGEWRKQAALPTLTTFSTAVWKRCATMAALLPAP